jgi:resolvase-like protein
MTQSRASLPVAIYLRVSTETQTTDNQRIALEAAAAARGWNVVRIYQDQGISGAKGRDKRPGLDTLLKDAAKGDFRLVAAWSVDRLGRSLQDLIGFLNEIQALGRRWRKAKYFLKNCRKCADRMSDRKAKPEPRLRCCGLAD